MKDIIKKLIINICSIFKIKNIIVFESHSDYSDNSRAFYEYLIKNNYNFKYKIYWFVNDAKEFKNREVHNVKFLTMWENGVSRSFIQWIKYFSIVKNAKFLIFSNRNLLKINKKTKKVSINHGSPIKSIKNHKVVPSDVDYRVDCSKIFEDIINTTQGLNKNQTIIVGNPRNDILFEESNTSKKLQNFNKFKKIILWLPTFRKSYHSDRKDSKFEFPLGLPVIYSFDKLEEINNYLKKLNMALIFKPHPAQDLSLFSAASLSNIIIIDNKYLIDNDVSLTELFKITDALITDYSSIYVDYLLTLKPIGFTIDDIEEYTNGFSFENILDYMPGLKIKNIEDFKKFIDSIYYNKDKYLSDRKRINNLFNEYQDGNSSERLAKKLNL